ncbi:MAG TPA: response regulator [Vicinamibacterales bacterium]|jgi:two-component system chemotaxis response regulator CheY
MRILVVDDSSTMRRIIINTLNKLGYTSIVEASNGREGLDRLSTNPVDLIVTDWNMPEMSGIEFIRSLRANDKTKAIPVLMVTTNAAKDDIVEALKAGVNNYVVKPFTPDIIKEKIEAVIGK